MPKYSGINQDGGTNHSRGHRHWLACLIAALLVLAGVGGPGQALPRAAAQEATAEASDAESAAATQDDSGPSDENAAENADDFVRAVSLLPEATAGVLRIPSLPDFCNAWQQTRIGALMASPEMQPFLDAQRENLINGLDSLDRKIGVKPQDLYDMASGEVVLAWLSFPEDKRRPYSLCVIADIRGMEKDAAAAAEKIDQDLKAGGSTRRDVTYGDDVIRVYRTKPKPGQLKIEEIAITWNDQRFIAADRDTVVQNLLDAISGKAPTDAFANRESFKHVISEAYTAIESAQEPDATVCWEWFAEPFALGRILREVFEYDRREEVDILNLLERQGFSVIEAIGGVGAVAGKRFDVLHRGVVLAPGTLTKAARMLASINAPWQSLPGWLPADLGAFYRVHWKLEDAFWAAESLVNDALGEDLFRPMIDGIKEDPEGPQIDIAKDFLPNLKDEVLLLRDNTTPASADSDRMLVALPLKDVSVVKEVIRKAMAGEADAIKLDVKEFDAWKVEAGEGDTDIDAELAALGFEEEIESEDSAPLLNHWAIAVVEGAGPEGADYLMFSSHADLLIKVGLRIQMGAEDGFGAQPETQRVLEAMEQLGADPSTFQAIVHPRVSLRSRYELLRKGELKDSDSLVSNLLRRLIQEKDEGQPDEIQAAKLPPHAEIAEYLNSGGSFWRRTDTGWTLTGFFLAE
ncbi:membrane or secreted protein [Roseiconus nitratireducens]|uniref:Membrane or secreted protein n=1 Tax=Roseiconus nitratireducens TaxID=2605748 RepID=A0A5M6DA81_9BACT|nr:membrane or secreted protein [Roseiconus nitratireducens]KAA5544444.1 membrane or secreted protein [Roseiconus nitratireducens]